MRWELRSNGDVVVRSLEGMAGRLADGRALLEDMGEHMRETSIPETFRQGGRPQRWPSSKWQSGENPMRDTLRLLRSVRHEVAGGNVLRVGTNLAYARQRHMGGPIVPRTKKALAFPLPDVPATMRRPRRWGDRLFMLPDKSGDPDKVGVLASRDRRGVVKARFLLRKRVEQPARPFLVFVDHDIAYLARQVVAAVQGAA